MLFSVDYVCWLSCVCVCVFVCFISLPLHARIKHFVRTNYLSSFFGQNSGKRRMGDGKVTGAANLWTNTLRISWLEWISPGAIQLRWQFWVHPFCLADSLHFYHLHSEFSSYFFFHSVKHFCKHQKRAVANRRNIKIRSLLSFPQTKLLTRGARTAIIIIAIIVIIILAINGTTLRFGTSFAGVVCVRINKWNFQMIFISQYLVCLFSSLRPKWCHFIIMAAFFFLRFFGLITFQMLAFFKHPNWHFVHPSNSI